MGLAISFGAPLGYMLFGAGSAGTWLPWAMGFGVLLLLLAFLARRSLGRGLGLGLGALLLGLAAFGMKAMELEAYEGPAQAGVAFPDFEAQSAAGEVFGPAQLRDGQRRLLVFYRGHW
jgi:hypothetical protein